MKILIIILQILGAFTIFPWFSMVGLSPIVIGSPMSSKRPLAWFLIASIFLYPFILGSSYWWAWNNFLEGNPHHAIFYSCLPLIIFGIAYALIATLTDFIDKIRNRK